MLPQPDSNLSSNQLVLGAELITILRAKGRPVVIETALREFVAASPGRTPSLFMRTLTFLYSIGLIECEGYNVKLKSQDGYTQLSLF